MKAYLKNSVSLGNYSVRVLLYTSIRHTMFG